MPGALSLHRVPSSAESPWVSEMSPKWPWVTKGRGQSELMEVGGKGGNWNLCRPAGIVPVGWLGRGLGGLRRLNPHAIRSA